jgi:predicted enzyme related to lactoylglutathione lyase
LYAVDDLETAYADVTGRGADPVSGPHVVHRDGSTELWMAFVADPDGTPVALMSERPAP